MPTIRKNVVFIDNLQENWKTSSVEDMGAFSDWIHYIPVSNETRSREEKYTKDLAKRGNLYAQALLRTGDSNPINCGITKRIANALKKWSMTPTVYPKYALFDWDGTISCTEGFSTESIQPFYIRNSVKQNTSTSRKRRVLGERTRRNWKLASYRPRLRPLVMPSKEFLDDMFVYMMTPERVNMLRDLFRTLQINGVRIHILTHNSYASNQSPYRTIFIEMLWRIFNEDTHQEYNKQYKDKDGTIVNVFSSSSSTVSVISREDINAMLHSTVDYTRPGEMPLKRNILKYIAMSMPEV